MGHHDDDAGGEQANDGGDEDAAGDHAARTIGRDVYDTPTVTRYSDPRMPFWLEEM